MLMMVAGFLTGMFTGVVTGLVPGLHPNTLLFLLLPVYLAEQPPLLIFIAFMTGMSVVHTFVSFIPSLLLGAADGDTALSVVPGHQYVLAGRGLEAIELTVYGGLIATVIALLSLPLLFLGLPHVYPVIRSIMPLLLVGAVLLLISRDTHPRATLGITLVAGVLGIIVLQSPAANTQYILFPLFAGMFGIATLLPAILRDGNPPPQEFNLPTSAAGSVRGGILGVLAGMIAGFLPGIGSSQSAFLVRMGTELRLRDFIVALGGITTTDLFFSIIALLVIGNPRSGAAVILQRIAPVFSMHLVLSVIGMMLVATGIGALATVALGGAASTFIHTGAYRTLMLLVVLLLVMGSAALTGWFGVVVLLTATGLGITCARFRVRRSACMAALVFPTILTYLGVPPLL